MALGIPTRRLPEGQRSCSMGWEGEEQTYKLQHGLVSGIARLLPQGSGIVDAAKEIGKDGSPHGPWDGLQVLQTHCLLFSGDADHSERVHLTVVDGFIQFFYP